MVALGARTRCGGIEGDADSGLGGGDGGGSDDGGGEDEGEAAVVKARRRAGRWRGSRRGAARWSERRLLGLSHAAGALTNPFRTGDKSNAYGGVRYISRDYRFCGT